MPAAKVEYKASVAGDLDRLDRADRADALRGLKKIEKTLAEEGRTGESLAGEFALYRLRVGDYRVIYARTETGYLVLRIGHRSDVYRRVGQSSYGAGTVNGFPFSATKTT